MNARLVLALAAVVVCSLQQATVCAQDSEAPDSEPTPKGYRVWSDANERTLTARLLAYDQVRATLLLDNGRVVFVAPNSLSEADREFLEEWREADPKAPWIDPNHMPPWPVEAGSGPTKVVAIKADGLAGRFVYHSAHFEIVADVALPLDTVAEMATAFEATRSALLTLPLGLGAKPEIKYWNGVRFVPASELRQRRPDGSIEPPSDRLRVELFITPQAYGLAGGPAGTGGYYSAWRRSTLISLQNFGIGAENGRVTLDYRDNLFIIRHEICHQLMSAWLPLMPVWLYEGFAEYMASLPYAAGRYRFRNFEQAFLQYLNKWRFEEDPRAIPMRPPAEMFRLDGKQWQAALSMDTPVVNYNSAALLAWFFLHQDGDGDASYLVDYFDSILRDPKSAKQAIDIHLLRQREPGQIFAELRAAWKKHGTDILIE